MSRHLYGYGYAGVAKGAHGRMTLRPNRTALTVAENSDGHQNEWGT